MPPAKFVSEHEISVRDRRSCYPPISLERNHQLQPVKNIHVLVLNKKFGEIFI